MIVTTLASSRITDTEQRKIYEDNGALLAHFTNAGELTREYLDKDEHGIIVRSLANLLKLHRPLVIVDEAHNARSNLSFETLERFRPAFILEFTATPQTEHNPGKNKYASNILCQISAAELKAEQMIKLPLRVHTDPDWKVTIQNALNKRSELAEIAKGEQARSGRYVRPIMLIQAQDAREGNDLTHDFVKRHLLDEHHIAAEEIAVATGSINELEGVNLLSETCPIKYIITVKKLGEGWDCPFAYILCSLAITHSERVIEQIVGRILRQPEAERFVAVDLNQSYAFVSSGETQRVINQLEFAMIENGFEKFEADLNIVYDDQMVSHGHEETFTRELSEVPALELLPRRFRQLVEYRPETRELAVIGPMDTELLVELEHLVTKPESRIAMEDLFRESTGLSERNPTLAEQGKVFKFPALAIKVRGKNRLFDDETYLEIDWHLSRCDASLSEAEFATQSRAGTIHEIDITKPGELTQRFIQELRNQQSKLFAHEPNWSINALANWLDRHLTDRREILPAESRAYIIGVLMKLMGSRGMTIEQLAARKYDLRDSLEDKIRQLKLVHYRESQPSLFEDATIDPEINFVFAHGRYTPNRYCERQDWQKHFFPVVGWLDSGEETDCARTIDQHPNVKTWIRNLVQRPESFRLPKPSGHYFYPDFLVQLKSEKFVIVEYKGEGYYDGAADAREVGELWEKRSRGLCRFVMPRGYRLNEVEAALN